MRRRTRWHRWQGSVTLPPTRARWALAVLLLGVAWLTLGPTRRRLLDLVTDLADAVTPGSPGSPGLTEVEVALNGLLLLPVAVLLVAALPRVRPAYVLLACVSLSAAVELTQATLLQGRHPSVRDFLFNSGGAAVGVLLAVLLLRRPADESA